MLGSIPRPSDRKLRLWVEVCRQSVKSGRSTWGYNLTLPTHLGAAVEDWSSLDYEQENSPLARRAALLRDILGNPWRPVTVDRCWLTPTVLSLAQDAYDQRDEASDHLDPVRLAILADALEEVGCTETDILAHLRSPGPHVRGCWVIDLILCRQ